MKAAYIGLWLSLMSGVAMAQSAPNDAPKTPPAPQGATTGAQDGMNAQAQRPPGDPNGNAGPDEQYEGEIIQTPNGAYVVSEPQGNGESMPPQAEGDEMEPQAPQGPQGMGPHPHPGHRMPPMSKAAHFRIKGPDLALDVKCPEDEPVKACVDAASQLIDKASMPHH